MQDTGAKKYKDHVNSRFKELSDYVNLVITSWERDVGKFNIELKRKEDEIFSLKKQLGTYEVNYKKLLDEYTKFQANTKARENSLILEFKRKEEYARSVIQKQADDIEKEKKQLRTKIDSLEKINNEHSFNIKDLQQANDKYKKEIAFYKDAAEQQRVAEQSHRKNVEKEPKYTSSGNLIEKFNSWASSPSSPLPREFSYLEGDIKIRMNQTLRPTGTKSRWICNLNDSVKYLLPNPNFFDQMTDISELYLMDLSMLKEKGKNRLRITVPCEILDSGFINFPGKLELL